MGNLNPGQHTCVNANDSVVDEILRNMSDFHIDVIRSNENGSCVDVILVNRNDLGVDVSQIDWIRLYTDSPHYHPSFLGYLSPFSGIYLSLLIPNLSPVCVTAPPPSLFPRIIHVLRHLISFGLFDVTSLRSQTILLLTRAPCLHVFFAFIPTMWILEKTPRIRSWHGLLNVFQTFFLWMSFYWIMAL